MSAESKPNKSYVREIFGPREAVKRGLRPGEYVQLTLDPEGFSSINGAIATAEIMNQLNSQVWVETRGLSSSGEVFLMIERSEGPKATLRDHLNYWWGRLRKKC